MFKDNYKARSNTSPPNIWKEQVRQDGGRYDKQGSAYAIRINREAIHRKDRGRGSARKGEGREGGVKGKERRGKGGEHEEGEEGMRKGGEGCNFMLNFLLTH